MTKNLFLQPSVVVAAFAALLLQAEPAIDDMLTNGVNARNIKDIVFALILVSGVAGGRYAEDDKEELYTPHHILGRDKEDANKNGIPDYLENTVNTNDFDAMEIQDDIHQFPEHW